MRPSGARNWRRTSTRRSRRSARRSSPAARSTRRPSNSSPWPWRTPPSVPIASTGTPNSHCARGPHPSRSWRRYGWQPRCAPAVLTRTRRWRCPPLNTPIHVNRRDEVQKPSLEAMARQLSRRAAEEGSGRAAETIYGGHEKRLRQTMIALTEGSELGEHDSPGDATVLVVQGRMRLVAGDTSWEGRSGNLLAVPEARHSVEAVTDTVFLLTVARR